MATQQPSMPDNTGPCPPALGSPVGMARTVGSRPLVIADSLQVGGCGVAGGGGAGAGGGSPPINSPVNPPIWIGGPPVRPPRPLPPGGGTLPILPRPPFPIGSPPPIVPIPTPPPGGGGPVPPPRPNPPGGGTGGPTGGGGVGTGGPGPGGGPPVNPAPPVSPAPPVNPTPPGPQPPTFPCAAGEPDRRRGLRLHVHGRDRAGATPQDGEHMHGDQPDDSPLESGIRLGRSRLHRSHGHHNGNEYHGRHRRHTEPADRPIQRDWRWPRRNRRCRRQPDHREVILAAAGHESSRGAPAALAQAAMMPGVAGQPVLPPLTFATGGCNSLGGKCVINPASTTVYLAASPRRATLLYRPRPFVFQRQHEYGDRGRHPLEPHLPPADSARGHPTRRSSPVRASRTLTQASEAAAGMHYPTSPCGQFAPVVGGLDQLHRDPARRNALPVWLGRRRNTGPVALHPEPGGRSLDRHLRRQQPGQLRHRSARPANYLTYNATSG